VSLTPGTPTLPRRVPPSVEQAESAKASTAAEEMREIRECDKVRILTLLFLTPTTNATHLIDVPEHFVASSSKRDFCHFLF
jgi:hypothetical protein